MRAYAMWVNPGRDMTEVAIEKNEIFLGWEGVFGFETCKERKDFVALVRRKFSRWGGKYRQRNVVGRWASQFYRFIREMKEGDWVVVPNRKENRLHLGEVTSPARVRKVEGEKFYVRCVEWTGAIPFQSIPKGLKHRVRPHQTCVEITPFLGQITKLFQKISDGNVNSEGTHRRADASIARKYGTGGEGEGKEHKQLKEWLAKNPRVLGLPRRSGVEIEHAFLSGDAVDLVFVDGKDSETVVEVETTDPLPGAHQLIKYRALLCAEKGIPLDSPVVKAILVAWSIPAEVRNFCDTYGLQAQEHKLRESAARPQGRHGPEPDHPPHGGN